MIAKGPFANTQLIPGNVFTYALLIPDNVLPALAFYEQPLDALLT